ncbi:GNAT family N-acetyltransferase [Babesia caballi]|uniref:GNAT family N-acetyltransferase n=1 Tax=Babesia caballi TaxID=5871 RepID=A0AAV4LXS0_BABCB|nr:GNAT family N-acetyltransferase [Babesia caballi]
MHCGLGSGARRRRRGHHGGRGLGLALQQLLVLAPLREERHVLGVARGHTVLLNDVVHLLGSRPVVGVGGVAPRVLAQKVGHHLQLVRANVLSHDQTQLLHAFGDLEEVLLVLRNYRAQLPHEVDLVDEPAAAEYLGARGNGPSAHVDAVGTAVGIGEVGRLVRDGVGALGCGETVRILREHAHVAAVGTAGHVLVLERAGAVQPLQERVALDGHGVQVPEGELEEAVAVEGHDDVAPLHVVGEAGDLALDVVADLRRVALVAGAQQGAAEVHAFADGEAVQPAQALLALEVADGLGLDDLGQVAPADGARGGERRADVAELGQLHARAVARVAGAVVAAGEGVGVDVAVVARRAVRLLHLLVVLRRARRLPAVGGELRADGALEVVEGHDAHRESLRDVWIKGWAQRGCGGITWLRVRYTPAPAPPTGENRLRQFCLPPLNGWPTMGQQRCPTAVRERGSP